MIYAQWTDMVERFSLREMTQLSDRDGIGEVNTSVLTRALDDATAFADSYLGRVYALPLAGCAKPVTTPGATMEFTAGSNVQTVTAPNIVSGTTTGAYSNYAVNPNGFNGFDYYYLREVDTYSGAYGPLTATATLGSADLTNAAQSGQIQWHFTNLLGQFHANSVSLNATIEAVPEPGTLLVFGAGLLALLGTRRRKVVEPA